MSYQDERDMASGRYRWDKPWGGPVAKSSGAAVHKTIRLLKADPGEDQQIVTGIVYAPGEVDSQGDFADAATIEKACYNFALTGGAPGVQHDPSTVGDGRIKILENYIAPCDLTFPGGGTATCGSWIQTFKILDSALWADVKAGRLTGLSLAGIAQRTPVAAGGA